LYLYVIEDFCYSQRYSRKQTTVSIVCSQCAVWTQRSTSAASTHRERVQERGHPDSCANDNNLNSDEGVELVGFDSLAHDCVHSTLFKRIRIHTHDTHARTSSSSSSSSGGGFTFPSPFSSWRWFLRLVEIRAPLVSCSSVQLSPHARAHVVPVQREQQPK
jgi:hypothetical protein